MSRSNPNTEAPALEELADPVVELSFTIIPPDLSLAVDSKQSIEQAFTPFFLDAVRLQKELSAITSPKIAKAARLEVKALRIAADKKRKLLNEDSQVKVKACNGANHLLLSIIDPLETSLENIELAEVRKLQAERLEWTRVRKELIEPYLDPTVPVPPDTFFTDLTDNQFEKVLEAAKAAHAARLEKAAKDAAEKVRKEAEEAAEKERIAKENEKLRLEAAAAAQKAADERAEAARVLAAERAKAAQEAAVAKAAADKLAAEKQAEVDRLRAEAKANNEKLRMASEASRNAPGPTVVPGTYRAPDAAPAYTGPAPAYTGPATTQAPPAATDKEKLLAIANLMETIPMNTVMTSVLGGSILKQVVVSRDKFVAWVREKATTLPSMTVREGPKAPVIDDL